MSDKLLRACAMFGVEPTELRARAHPADAPRLARGLNRLLRPGEVALITGPSGGGKSTILRAMSEASGAVIVPPSAALRTRCSPRASLIDCFQSDLDAALGYLSRAGLADATILPLALDELSEGQRFRARLALAFESLASVPPVDPPQAGRTGAPTLLIDEFASTLDRPTARTLAHLVNRWASRGNIRVVCATAHDDLLDALRPAVLVVQPLLRPATIARSPWAPDRCASLTDEELA